MALHLAGAGFSDGPQLHSRRGRTPPGAVAACKKSSASPQPCCRSRKSGYEVRAFSSCSACLLAAASPPAAWRTIRKFQFVALSTATPPARPGRWACWPGKRYHRLLRRVERYRISRCWLTRMNDFSGSIIDKVPHLLGCQGLQIARLSTTKIVNSQLLACVSAGH